MIRKALRKIGSQQESEDGAFDHLLIGQVVLELLDLLPDCKNQHLTPNPRNPDYPVAIIK